jgi:NAD(P)-dependent dehydrogenase (short-subunit alcohol dehydrogenase family)
VEAIPLELGSLAGVCQFVEEFQHFKSKLIPEGSTTPPLHALINNAGMMGSSRTTTVDGFETHFGVNYLVCTSLKPPLIVQPNV